MLNTDSQFGRRILPSALGALVGSQQYLLSTGCDLVACQCTLVENDNFYYAGVVSQRLSNFPSSRFVSRLCTTLTWTCVHSQKVVSGIRLCNCFVFTFLDSKYLQPKQLTICYCPASRTTLVATRFWVVMICPIIKCLTVLEFSFILFDLCLFITIFNFILNYVPIVTFWIFTYHKIWILLIIFCFIWSYWIIYFSTSLEVFWSVVS